MKKIVLMGLILLCAMPCYAMIIKYDSEDFKNRFGIQNVTNISSKLMCLNSNCISIWPSGTGSFDQNLNTTSYVRFRQVIVNSSIGNVTLQDDNMNLNVQGKGGGGYNWVGKSYITIKDQNGNYQMAYTRDAPIGGYPIGGLFISNLYPIYAYNKNSTVGFDDLPFYRGFFETISIDPRLGTDYPAIEIGRSAAGLANKWYISLDNITGDLIFALNDNLSDIGFRIAKHSPYNTTIYGRLNTEEINLGNATKSKWDLTDKNISYVIEYNDTLTDINFSTILNVSSALTTTIWQNGTLNHTVYDNTILIKWSLDNNSVIGENNSRIVDTSINNNKNSSSLSNCFYINGIAGLGFNGSGNCNVQFSDANLPTGGANRTLMGWTYREDSSTWRWVFQYGTGSSTALWAIGFNNQYIGASQYGSAVAGNTSVPLNEWHHIVWMSSGNTWSFYIDGQPSGGGTMTTNTALEGTGSFGGYDGGPDYFRGYLDEFVFFNRTLTNSEIRAHYRNTLRKINSTSWNFTMKEYNLINGTKYGPHWTDTTTSYNEINVLDKNLTLNITTSVTLATDNNITIWAANYETNGSYRIAASDNKNKLMCISVAENGTISAKAC